MYFAGIDSMTSESSGGAFQIDLSGQHSSRHTAYPRVSGGRQNTLREDVFFGAVWNLCIPWEATTTFIFRGYN